MPLTASVIQSVLIMATAATIILRSVPAEVQEAVPAEVRETLPVVSRCAYLKERISEG